MEVASLGVRTRRRYPDDAVWTTLSALGRSPAAQPRVRLNDAFWSVEQPNVEPRHRKDLNRPERYRNLCYGEPVTSDHTLPELSDTSRPDVAVHVGQHDAACCGRVDHAVDARSLAVVAA